MPSARSLPGKLLTVDCAAILSFLVLAIGQGVWGALLVANLKTNPAVPWAVPVMAVVLSLMWKYLGGSWWPRSTSQARRLDLRAHRVPGPVLAWSLLAGGLSNI